MDEAVWTTRPDADEEPLVVPKRIEEAVETIPDSDAVR